jgi:hypothetical protein
MVNLFIIGMVTPDSERVAKPIGKSSQQQRWHTAELHFILPVATISSNGNWRHSPRYKLNLFDSKDLLFYHCNQMRPSYPQEDSDIPGPAHEVNLSVNVRDALLRHKDLSIPPISETIDPAVKSIHNLMEISIFASFLNTPSVLLHKDPTLKASNKTHIMP